MKRSASSSSGGHAPSAKRLHTLSGAVTLNLDSRSDTDDEFDLEWNGGALKSDRKGRLRATDVAQLLQWLVGDGINTQWLTVRNRRKLSFLAVLRVEGMAAIKSLLLHLPQSNFKTLRRLLLHTNTFPVDWGGDFSAAFAGTVQQSLPNSPAASPLRASDTPGSPARNIAREAPKPAKLSIANFILSKKERKRHGYPTMSLVAPQGYVQLKSWKASRGTPPEAVALDCEMCETAAGPELTRISIVDCSGKVLMDDLVKPEVPIIDYKTQYSGITAEMLKDVTTTLQDAQRRLADIISADSIIVGHSLENDLHALRLFHPRVVDTAILFPHARDSKRKNSLRYLTKRFLGRVIQQGEHDSTEDARAALELALLKAKHGRDFGTCAPSSNTLLLSRLQPSSFDIVSYEVSNHMLIRQACPHVNVVPARSDRDALRGARSHAHSQRQTALFVHLRDVSRALINAQVSPQGLLDKLSTLEYELGHFLEALPRSAAIVVVGGADTRAARSAAPDTPSCPSSCAESPAATPPGSPRRDTAKTLALAAASLSSSLSTAFIEEALAVMADGLLAFHVVR